MEKNKYIYLFLFIIAIIGALILGVRFQIIENNTKKFLHIFKNLDTQEIKQIEVFKDSGNKKIITDVTLIFEFVKALSKMEKWIPRQPVLRSFASINIILKAGNKYKLTLYVNRDFINSIVYIYFKESWDINARYKNSELYDFVLKVIK